MVVPESIQPSLGGCLVEPALGEDSSDRFASLVYLAFEFWRVAGAVEAAKCRVVSPLSPGLCDRLFIGPPARLGQTTKLLKTPL
jgi:hypothetical protein